MKKIAFLFPGQGSQAPGMGKDFYDTFAVAREVFEEADDILSYRLSKVMFEGPEEILTETRHSQLAIFVNSLALLKTLQEHLPELVPTICAGLSLGEYTALFASKKIEMAEALRLVQTRADLMNRACEEKAGAMSAVLGISAPKLEEALLGMKGVWIANYNCPGQIVISGTKEGVETAAVALKAAGAKRVIPLSVHGAFHSGLMQSAQDGLAPFLEKANFKESSIDLVMNVPGDFVSSIDSMRSNLIQQVTNSVRWEQGILAIQKKQPDIYLEIGSGKTLTGFNKKIGVSSPALSLEKVTDLDAVLQQIEGVVCSC